MKRRPQRYAPVRPITEVGNKNVTKCSHCKSAQIVSNGYMYRFRNGKKYKQQRFVCKKCGRTTMGSAHYVDGK